MSGGILIRTWKDDDPRFSTAQRRAVLAAASADREARLLGLDAKFRPVVQARLGHPRTERVYAVQGNGDPTEPELLGDVTGAPLHSRLREPWESRA